MNKNNTQKKASIPNCCKACETRYEACGLDFLNCEIFNSIHKKQTGIKTPWSKISFEDKRSIVGGGRAGFEAREKHNLGDRR